MTASTDLRTAREILDGDIVGPEELRRVFGSTEGIDPARAEDVPFSPEELRRAKQAGEFLILRASASAGAPITLRWLIEHFADAFDPGSLRKMGYQLKDEWGIELEPLAATETCRPAWALVRKHILEPTRNLTYEEQDEQIRAEAAERNAAGTLRRRSAIEIAFDTIAMYRARSERLLANSWDWSSSRTLDGGYLNLGRFNDKGMQVFSYSPAVRHGLLGVCPNRDPDV